MEEVWPAMYFCIVNNKNMQTKKTIAIIGATGKMGLALAKSLAKGYNRLLLMGRDTGKLNAIAEEIKTANTNVDVDVTGCPKEASWEADVIIAAVPYSAGKEIAEKIKPFATGKVIITIASPLNENYTGIATATGTSAAEELQKLLPNSKVVRAFNSTFAAGFAHPEIDGTTADCFIAGNDEEALQTVSDLVKVVGFNPIIAGDLSAGRKLESMQALHVRLP
jgi:NADPH-dependent F420 reductase